MRLTAKVGETLGSAEPLTNCFIVENIPWHIFALDKIFQYFILCKKGIHYLFKNKTLNPIMV